MEYLNQRHIFFPFPDRRKSDNVGEGICQHFGWIPWSSVLYPHKVCWECTDREKGRWEGDEGGGGQIEQVTWGSECSEGPENLDDEKFMKPIVTVHSFRYKEIHPVWWPLLIFYVHLKVPSNISGCNQERYKTLKHWLCLGHRLCCSCHWEI